MVHMSQTGGVVGHVKRSLTAKQMLMKRRALRRHKGVRDAINRFWKVKHHPVLVAAMAAICARLLSVVACAVSSSVWL